MEQTPSWQADSRLPAGYEIPSLYGVQQFITVF
jgi:hypothetical protein